MSDAPLSHWQRCYLAVEAESDSDKLRDKIYEARSSLIARYKELASQGVSPTEAERSALLEAARGLRDAEIARLGYAEAVGDEGGSAMAATQTRYEFQPFCYEHQVEMKPDQTLRRIEKGPAKQITFACPRPDCLLHYNSSLGYFLLKRDRNGKYGKLEPGLLIRCERDRAPMFLFEFFPNRWTLRLWKCPLCKTVRANAEISAAQHPSVAQ